MLALVKYIPLARMVWRNGRLGLRLLRDQRTPLLPKVILASAVLYAFSPLDLITDVIPFLGQVDDVAILVLGMDLFLKKVPNWLRAEHEAALRQPERL